MEKKLPTKVTFRRGAFEPKKAHKCAIRHVHALIHSNGQNKLMFWPIECIKARLVNTYANVAFYLLFFGAKLP